MQKKKKSASDIKNIVPVFPTEEAFWGSTTPPKLVYNGGPLLAHVEVVPVFWGDAWIAQPAQKLTQQYIFLFLQFLVTSPVFIGQLTEYSVPNYTIGNGSVAPSINIPHTFQLPIVRDATIETLIQQQISSGQLPQPNKNKLYIVFTPTGIRVQKNIGVSCLTFCGYHDVLNTNIFYAVIPYPDCSTCHGNLSVIDALYTIISHELAEAITDPVPGKGWYDSNKGEIGDICSFKTKNIPNSGYVIQQEWSNKNNSCG